jgi:hypothetical protein
MTFFSAFVQQHVQISSRANAEIVGVLLRIALYASWSSGPKLGEYRTQHLVLVF